MERYKSFVWDIGLISVANIINNFKSVLIIPLLTKFLGAYQYGIWTQLKITITLLIPFLTLGAAQSIVKFLPGEDSKDKIKEDFSSCLFASFFTSLLSAIFCFIFSAQISGLILGSQEYQFLIKVFSILLIFETCNFLLLEYFKGFRFIKAYFNILVGETIFEFSLIAFVIIKGYGILGAIVSLLVTRCIFVLVRLMQVILNSGFGWPKFINLRKYIAFGMPLVFSVFFLFILNWGNRYLINYFLGLKEVGIFSVAYFIAYLITFIAAPIGYILFPTLSSCINKSRKEEASIYLKYSFKYFFMAGIPLVFLLSFVSKELLVLFSTAEFLVAKSYLPLLLIGIFTVQLGVLGEYVNIIFNKNMLILRVYIIMAAVNIFLNIMLIPIMGLMGAATAMFLSFLGYSVFNLLYCQRFIRFGIDFATIFKILSSTLGMLLCLYIFKIFCPGFNILFFVPISSLLYVLFLYICRCFTEKEIILFKSLIFNKKAA